MGDERPTHQQYHNRRKAEVHIEAIPASESYDSIDSISSHQPTASGMSVTVMNAEAEQQIKVLLNQGKIIPAIQLYRKVTGHGLREAKDVITEMIRQMQLESRQR